jgi:hypothetical protein
MSAGTGASIRTAIQNELNGRPELTKTEALIMGGFEGMSRDNIRIVRSQQALHALLDTFAKQFLRACRSHRSTRSSRPSPEPRTGTTY